jgi:hypothetical protein
VLRWISGPTGEQRKLHNSHSSLSIIRIGWEATLNTWGKNKCKQIMVGKISWDLGGRSLLHVSWLLRCILVTSHKHLCSTEEPFGSNGTIMYQEMKLWF